MRRALQLLLILATAGVAPACQENAAGPAPYQGVVEFDEVRLAFESAGHVTALSVQQGDFVAAGQSLARLDDELGRSMLAARTAEADVAKAQSALVHAGARAQDVRAMRARLRAARIERRYLKEHLDRRKALLAVSAVTPGEVDADRARYKEAVAQAELVRQQLSALKSGARPEEVSIADERATAASAAAALEAARVARLEMLSPIDGEVLDTLAEEGEMVFPGTAVLVVADTTHPFADVFVPQGQLDGLTAGAPATLRVDATSDAFHGVIEHVSRRTEFTPRFLYSERQRPDLVVRVRVRIVDPKRRLHAGVPAFVDFPAAGERDVR